MKHFKKIKNSETMIFEKYNYEILMEIVDNIINYLDKPSRDKRKEIKSLVGEFRYSKKLIVLPWLLDIFDHNLINFKLFKILCPLIATIRWEEDSKRYKKDKKDKKFFDLVEKRLVLKKQIEDEIDEEDREEDKIRENTIKSLQSINIENNNYLTCKYLFKLFSH